MINVRNWSVGKIGELGMQMEENGMDFLAVTQTNLRDGIEVEWGKFKFKGMGRRLMKKGGGGIGILYNETKGIKIEQIEYSSKLQEKEDIGVFRLYKEGEKGGGEIYNK